MGYYIGVGDVLGKRYGALRGGVWVSVTGHYMVMGVSGQAFEALHGGGECLSKRYEALHGGVRGVLSNFFSSSCQYQGGCLGKHYEALHGGGGVWVSLTEHYMGWGCLGKPYGELHGGGVSG